MTWWIILSHGDEVLCAVLSNHKIAVSAALHLHSYICYCYCFNFSSYGIGHI